MFKFIHAADIHLDSPLRGLSRYDEAPIEEIRGASRKTLQNLVQLALKEKVRFIIFSGDMFDGSNNLSNLQKEGDNRRIRFIEEDFHRLMRDALRLHQQSTRLHYQLQH